MRSSLLLLLFAPLAAASRLAVRQSAPPACATQCLTQVAVNPPAGCTATDTACLCNSPALTVGFSDCLTNACSDPADRQKGIDFGVQYCAAAGVNVSPSGASAPATTATDAFISSSLDAVTSSVGAEASSIVASASVIATSLVGGASSAVASASSVVSGALASVTATGALASVTSAAGSKVSSVLSSASAAASAATGGAVRVLPGAASAVGVAGLVAILGAMLVV